MAAIIPHCEICRDTDLGDLHLYRINNVTHCYCSECGLKEMVKAKGQNIENYQLKGCD